MTSWQRGYSQSLATRQIQEGSGEAQDAFKAFKGSLDRFSERLQKRREELEEEPVSSSSTDETPTPPRKAGAAYTRRVLITPGQRINENKVLLLNKMYSAEGELLSRLNEQAINYRLHESEQDVQTLGLPETDWDVCQQQSQLVEHTVWR